MLLPLVVRGRWLAIDLLGAGLWAAGLVAAHAALGDMLAATTALDQARGRRRGRDRGRSDGRGRVPDGPPGGGLAPRRAESVTPHRATLTR